MASSSSSANFDAASRLRSKYQAKAASYSAAASWWNSIGLPAIAELGRNAATHRCQPHPADCFRIHRNLRGALDGIFFFQFRRNWTRIHQCIAAELGCGVVLESAPMISGAESKTFIGLRHEVAPEALGRSRT